MILLTIIILGIDFFFYKVLKSLLAEKKKIVINIILYSHGSFSILFLGSIYIFYFFTAEGYRIYLYRDMYILVGVFMLLYIPKLLIISFRILDAVVVGIQFLFRKTRRRPDKIPARSHTISRKQFITQTGIMLASIPFGSILWGMGKVKFHFKIHHHKISFPTLPHSFHGLKIVQISDLHLGSLVGKQEEIYEAVKMINDQQADIIFFTGDLVNNFAEETTDWIPVLSEIKAEMGKFSVLGNHDYGDYYSWENKKDKEKNLLQIKAVHEKIGFRLLCNESASLSLSGDKIAVMGLENWGLPPFKQYGDLKQTFERTEDTPFKILLSHDPTHWDAEVLQKTNIDLTFAGHTHGMQMGVEYKNMKWSPAQWKYPRWAGLYKEGGQYLYVNRGLGYIGYPGRIGMYPEITVIELVTSS